MILETVLLEALLISAVASFVAPTSRVIVLDTRPLRSLITIFRGERKDIAPSSSSSVSQGGSIDASLTEQIPPSRHLPDFARAFDLVEEDVPRVETLAPAEGVRQSEPKGTQRSIDLLICLI